MCKLNPRGWRLWWVARLVANMADKEQQPKCAKLSLSLPKDQFSFSVDDKDLEEAMKMYLVKNTVFNSRWALKFLRTGLKQSRIKLRCH